MKRKIALLLAAVMTTAMLPMNVMASSSNSVNRIDTVKEDEVIQDVQLKIEPKAAVASGASIIIEVQNGEFDKERIDFDSLQYSIKGTSYDWDYYLSEVADKADADGTISDNSLVSVLKGIMDTSAAKTDQLPYRIKRLNDHEAQVYLAQLPDRAVDTAGVVSNGKPYYLIPISAVATSDDEDVKIVIDDNGTSISSTTHTVAKTAADNGSTTTTVSKIATGYDSVKVDEITVKESVKGTFEQGKVKVRVNGGFKIINEENIVIEGSRNIEGKVTDITVDDSGSYFTFEIPASWTDTKNASGFTINGLEVEPNDEDKNWGDINITISGSNANITKETIKVGERVDYGFTMEVTDEVPTIISGRTHLANDDLDEDDFESATVSFKETAQDTWIGSRKLEFTVPDGVKIVDVEFDEVDRIHTTDGKDTKDQTALEEKAAISGDGHVLKINKGLEGDYGSEKVDGIEFEFNLYLSIDADFEGDVTLAVAGAGLAADTLEDVTIAEAVKPITVTIDENMGKYNMGYQVYDASDITITEIADGVLLDDEEVVIAFDDKKFGNYEIGFNDSDVEYSIDGEIEIDDFEVYNGAITFDIDKPSYSEPSSITISNITIGTTRSVPYGEYDLKISGGAVVNNYKDKIDDVYDIKFDEIDKTDSKGNEVNEDRAYFDTSDGYAVPKYVSIITETNTLDGVVKVTKGEQVITINGEPMDMGVAPYMQQESGSMLVPLRFVALALGVDSEKAGSVETADTTQRISFDANSKTATIIYGTGASEKIIQFQAGSNVMVMNGTAVPMEYGATAVIENDRIFVPFRALGTAFGVPVSWDETTNTASYNER